MYKSTSIVSKEQNFDPSEQGTQIHDPEKAYQAFSKSISSYDEDTEIELVKMIGDPTKSLCDCLWFLMEKRNWSYPDTFNSETGLHKNYHGREIHKLLRNAFNQGVKWELMSRNPVLNATLPKAEHKQRDIWTADILFRALEVCDDDNLTLALNLAFSCSLRMGEMLGLTWDCIDISEESIMIGCPYIFITKELHRGHRVALA